MKLDRLSLWMEQRLHQVHLAFEIAEIIAAFFLIGGDDRRATAEPAQGLAERQMEIEGEIARREIIGADFLDESFRRNFAGEMRGRRIRGVPRTGHVVLLHQIEIYFQEAHLNCFTVSTRLAMFSSFAFGGTPWPRLKICPGRPRISSKIRVVSAATISA